MTPFTKDLLYGSFGAEVKNLQTLLEQYGYGNFVPTGFFGSKTQAALKAFQKDYDITQTGTFGPLTRAKLNSIIGYSPREILFLTALECLGTDASPNDLAPDELGCAETVTTIIQKAGFDFPIILGTAPLYQALRTSPQFIQVLSSPLRGDILVSPTGHGNGNLSNGHTGIMGDDGLIMSNDSASGKFKQNYTLDSWKARYVDKGGFPMEFFRKV